MRLFDLVQGKQGADIAVPGGNEARRQCETTSEYLLGLVVPLLAPQSVAQEFQTVDVVGVAIQKLLDQHFGQLGPVLPKSGSGALKQPVGCGHRLGSRWRRGSTHKIVLSLRRVAEPHSNMAPAPLSTPAPRAPRTVLNARGRPRKKCGADNAAPLEKGSGGSPRHRRCNTYLMVLYWF